MVNISYPYWRKYKLEMCGEKVKTLLITGGAGFIGSNFIKYILEKYHAYKIINIDALTYAGNLENLKDIADKSNYVFIKADIRDRDKIEEVFINNEVTAVVNFAAESHVDRSIEINLEVFFRCKSCNCTFKRSFRIIQGGNCKVENR